MLAPAFMTILFLALFLQFSRISSEMAAKEGTMQAEAKAVPVNLSQLVNGKEIKMVDSNGNPKAFVAIDQQGLDELKLKEGDKSLGDNKVYIGAEEAKMMREEKLFTRTGDKIQNFFGAPEVEIAGVLEPTGTVLDYYHFTNSQTIKEIGNNEARQANITQ